MTLPKGSKAEDCAREAELGGSWAPVDVTQPADTTVQVKTRNFSFFVPVLAPEGQGGANGGT